MRGRAPRLKEDTNLLESDLPLVIGPQQRKEPRIERACGAIPGFLLRQRNGAAHDLGLELDLGVFLKKRAGEKRLFGGGADDDAAMAAHLRDAMVAERARQIG